MTVVVLIGEIMRRSFLYDTLLLEQNRVVTKVRWNTTTIPVFIGLR